MSDSKNQEIKERINSLTIHGVSKVFTTESLLSRFVWLIFCTCLVTLLSYTFVRSYIKYSSFEVYEKIEVKQNKLLPLPAMTFCHTDYYNPDAYTNIEPPVFQYFPKNCSFSGREHFKNDINMHIFRLFCRVFMGTFNAKSSAIGYFLPQYFQFPNRFTLLPNTHPCVTMNRNSTLVQQASGENDGVNLILYASQIHDPFFKYEVESPLLERRQGIAVHLHEPKQHVPIKGGILLPVGFHTRISITKNSIKRLPSPYPSGCIQGGSDKGSIFPGKNTQDMCIASCIHKSLYNKCSGIFPEMTAFVNPGLPRNVSYGDAMECLVREMQFADSLKCTCQPHCFDETYSYRTSRSPWPSKLQLSTLSNLLNKVEGVDKRNLTLEELRGRLMKVSIGYTTFKEVAHEEVPVYDMLSIASDVGGQMGLFLGASLISLIEIASLLLMYIWIRIFGKRKVPSTVIVNSASLKS